VVRELAFFSLVKQLLSRSKKTYSTVPLSGRADFILGGQTDATEEIIQSQSSKVPETSAAFESAGCRN
jgi:hypothetical protein